MLLNIGSHSSLPSRANLFGAPNKFSMRKTKWKVASWQLRQNLPTDGLPVLEDWLTVWEQMVFAGVDLAREPVDVSDPILEQLQMNVFNVLRFQIKTHSVTRSKWPQDWMLLQAVTCQYVDSCLLTQHLLQMSWQIPVRGQKMEVKPLSIDIVKGFTKIQCVLFTMLLASDLDPATPEGQQQLEPFFAALDKSWLVPVRAAWLKWLLCLKHLAKVLRHVLSMCFFLAHGIL